MSLPETIVDSRNVDVAVSFAKTGERSPVWELVGHRHDGDQVHFNGDQAAGLPKLVGDLLESPDIDHVALTLWLEL